MPRLIEQFWQPVDGSGLTRKDREGGPYQAFVPDMLSDLTFRLTPELSQHIVAVEKKIRALGESNSAQSLEAISRFLLRSEAIASSRIEGIAPNSDKIAMAILAQGSDDQVRGFADSARAVARNVSILNSVQDILAHQETLHLQDFVELQGQLVEKDSLAGIRDSQNWIGGSNYTPLHADFVPPPACELPVLLDDLMMYLNGADHAALVQAALVHAQFETIHPFPDGNGRIGRAMIHAVLQRRGLTRAAVLPVSMVLATLGQGYVSGLTSFRRGEVTKWIEFFVNAAEIAAAKAAQLAHDIEELKENWNSRIDIYRQDQGLTRALRSDSAERKILDILVAMPLLTVTTAQDELNLSASSARKALDALSEAKIVRRKNIGPGGLHGYFADDVFALVDAAERQLASTQFDTRLAPPSGRAVPGRRD